MSKLLNFDEAINLLKNAVKYSTIDNQKHMDLSLVNADERVKYQEALVVIRQAVVTGDKTQAEVNEILGIG